MQVSKACKKETAVLCKKGPANTVWNDFGDVTDEPSRGVGSLRPSPALGVSDGVRKSFLASSREPLEVASGSGAATTAATATVEAAIVLLGVETDEDGDEGEGVADAVVEDSLGVIEPSRANGLAFLSGPSELVAVDTGVATAAEGGVTRAADSLGVMEPSRANGLDFLF